VSEQIAAHCEVIFILTFQNHTNRPLTDFGGKTSIFSHPVYLFLREFSLQDFRGGSDGALITGLTFLAPKDATRVQGFFQHLQVRFGDGPWQDVKGLDEVGSDTGRTGE
ncbi:phage tail fiber C-terminal domain-containing protein, partial [Escherichia coli]|uniref:phage tail fiber C-terminal domain-containing protein n=15 Tax=Escherichia coli TaxID=562 RepID=UPI000B66CCE7